MATCRTGLRLATVCHLARQTPQGRATAELADQMDSDGGGMFDSNEAAFELDSCSADAQPDPDEDRFSNLYGFLAD